jgi:hypothetical protein
MHSWGIPKAGLTYQVSIKPAWNKYLMGMIEKYLASLPDTMAASGAKATESIVLKN